MLLDLTCGIGHFNSTKKSQPLKGHGFPAHSMNEFAAIGTMDLSPSYGCSDHFNGI